MKDGKLEISDVGKKFRREGWKPIDKYFVLSFICPDGSLFGHDKDGKSMLFTSNQGFVCYENPKQKKRIEAVPAVYKQNGSYVIGCFCDLKLLSEDAESFAQWDDVKKCWFYEWEE